MLRVQPRRQPRPPTTQEVTAPVPRGMNTIDSVAEMPPGECPLLVNLISAEQGLRNRPGSSEFASVSGLAAIRSVVPFHGNTSSADRLFAMTASDIWNVTAGGLIGAPIVNLPSSTGASGVGHSTTFTTAADRFLVYCDEEHGLYYYRESTATWARIAVGVSQPWTPSTAYLVGNAVTNGGNIYQCDTNGTSASSGGPTGTGADIVDGTTRWDYVSAASATAIGPSLADQNLGYSSHPNSFVFACAWKGRLFFVEKNTTRMWYLGLGAVYGVATSFELGRQFRAGGVANTIHNWTRDGGDGLDALMAITSTGGDFVVYQGTDPASISTFALRGIWNIGKFPAYARRCAVEHGGEIYTATSLGLIPASMLLAGADPRAARIPEQRLNNTIRDYILAPADSILTAGLIVHPKDNALMVFRPTAAEQCVFAFGSRTWSKYLEYPINNAGGFRGELYFGNSDGVVYKSTGHSEPAETPIQWGVVLTAQSLGTPAYKRVVAIIPRIFTPDGNGKPGVEVFARHSFDIARPTTSQTPSASALKEHSQMFGASGMGRSATIAIAGKSKVRTLLVDIGILFERGGPL